MAERSESVPVIGQIWRKGSSLGLWGRGPVREAVLQKYPGLRVLIILACALLLRVLQNANDTMANLKLIVSLGQPSASVQATHMPGDTEEIGGGADGGHPAQNLSSLRPVQRPVVQGKYRPASAPDPGARRPQLRQPTEPPQPPP